MDWVQLLDDNSIPFVSRGPNTKRGEVSVHCPFCGDEDPSEHMGIALEREVWGCHRNGAHRGKSPYKLVQALLGCSFSQAKLVVSQYSHADPETLDQALLSLNAAPEGPEKAPERLQIPPEFKAVTDTGLRIRFYNYLQKRGFDDPIAVAEAYDLKCCLTGRWKDRLIIPIYQAGELVAWTGRALSNPHNAPRYLSTSDAIKRSIFNEDELRAGGNCLFVTEGPLDAIKVDFYAREYDARATCVFGTSITIDQISIIRQVMKNFTHTVLLLDPEAIESAFDTIEWLPGTVMGTIPLGVEDPGALSKEQVIKIARDYTSN
jgi:hypothetical protein